MPLGAFGEGRLSLPPGRKGEVIPVLEEELATIIAYSLASQVKPSPASLPHSTPASLPPLSHHHRLLPRLASDP